MFWVKPVPALKQIGSARLLRINDKKCFSVGQRVHPGNRGQIFCVLRAAVQHHD
jgi:hypothetical protein